MLFTTLRHSFFQNRSGNVFAMLFGGVALAGVLGATTMQFIRGPLTTAVNVNRQTTAEAQMSTSAQLAMTTAAGQANGGDCDDDAYVEPLPWKAPSGKSPQDASGSEGGGMLPDTIGASKNDPWGTSYGYCVWDHGAEDGSSDAGCGTSVPNGGSQNRLEGTDDQDRITLAIISAGKDRKFETACKSVPTANSGNGKIIDKKSGADDIIFSRTYQEAAESSGGLWELKTSESDTATQQAPDVEVTGSKASFDTKTGKATFQLLKTDGLIHNPDTAQTHIDVNSVTQFTNNVGIGTASPVTDAEIVGSLNLGASDNISSPGTESSFQGNSSSAGYGFLEVPWIYTNGCIESDQKGGNATALCLGAGNQFSGADDTISLVTLGNERVTVKPDGKVGIGTSSPDSTDYGSGGRVVDIREPDDSEIAQLNVRGSGQGSGMLLLSQGNSGSAGGGLMYNGDDNPDMLNGVDTLTLFRRDSGTDYPLMHWQWNDDVTRVHGKINMKGNDITNRGDIWWGVISFDPDSSPGGQYITSNGVKGTISVPGSGNSNCDSNACLKHYSGSKWAAAFNTPAAVDFGYSPHDDLPGAWACHGISAGDNDGSVSGWGSGARSTITDDNGHCAIGSFGDGCASVFVYDEKINSHDVYGVVCRKLH